MFNINFYFFTKAKNSTKRPEGDGVSYHCELIQGTSTYNPTITLNIGVANVARTNYCYIPELGRYYFVTNWSWEDGLWSADLETDVLATWKIDIGNLTAYVLRSASEYDGYIQDGMYPIKSKATHTIALPGAIKKFNPFYGQGTFILGVYASHSDSQIGTTTYYALSESEFKDIMTQVFNPSGYPQSDISQELLTALFNPIQYVTSCVWLPFKKDVIPTDQQNGFYYGWWMIEVIGSGASVDVVANDGIIVIESTDIELPKHPQQGRGKYLNGSPYSSYQISAYEIGQLDINPDVDATKIKLTYRVDVTTGKCICRIKQYNGTTELQDLGCMDMLLGIPIQISSSATNILGGLGSMASSVTAGAISASVKNPAGVISGLLSGVESAVDCFKTNYNKVGVNGGGASISGFINLVAKFYEVADEDRTDKGRPLCKVRKLNTLSGYIQCAESEYSLPCYGAEYEAISAYLSGGFFYE